MDEFHFIVISIGNDMVANERGQYKIFIAIILQTYKKQGAHNSILNKLKASGSWGQTLWEHG